MRTITILALFQVLFGLLAVADVTDAQLRHILERATRYEDNPHASWGEIRYAIREAGGNSNRVVSLMKQMIVEGAQSDGATGFYLSEIGKYGTNADLPFLYQRVSETNFCEVATEAILKIEGLTTNSLMRLTTLIPDERPGAWDGVYAWLRLIEAAKKISDMSTIKALALSNAVMYASRQTESVDSLDRCLMKTDPTYRKSRRRLSVLRSISGLGANECQTNYVAQAIRELEANPEADLPE